VHEEGEEGEDIDVQAEREAVQAEGPGRHHTVSDSVVSGKCVIQPVILSGAQLRKCQPPICTHSSLMLSLTACVWLAWGCGAAVFTCEHAWQLACPPKCCVCLSPHLQ
jgi:hypothetical protein